MSVMTSNETYTVDGGVVLDEMSGMSRVDLVGPKVRGKATRFAAHLFVTKGLCPMIPR